MKFSDKPLKMKNYFMDTPIYKIWIDYINSTSPKMSFIISQKNFAFKHLKCTREEIIKVYENNEIQLEMIFALESRFFYCRKIDKRSSEALPWTEEAPTVQKVDGFSDLEVEIEKWMQFLKSNL